MDRRSLGKLGENMAADLLAAKGYTILKRNYRCRFGEIDIIAEKMGDVSFVEVKTRQNFNYGRPCEAIGREKKQHIRRAAHCFLEEERERGYVPRRYDFQVVEIVACHTEHAF